MRKIISQSLGSLFFIKVLRVAGIFTRFFHYKFIGSFSRFGSRLFNKKNVIIALDDNSYIEVDLLDYYWSRLIFNDYEYEPEIAMIFPFKLSLCSSSKAFKK